MKVKKIYFVIMAFFMGANVALGGEETVQCGRIIKGERGKMAKYDEVPIAILVMSSDRRGLINWPFISENERAAFITYGGILDVNDNETKRDIDYFISINAVVCVEGDWHGNKVIGELDTISFKIRDLDKIVLEKNF